MRAAAPSEPASSPASLSDGPSTSLWPMIEGRNESRGRNDRRLHERGRGSPRDPSSRRGARGITVRSRSVIGNIGAGIQSLFGGNITIYTELAEKARAEAFDLMVQHAQSAGANAIVGMRYDANEIADGITEVLAYGTAVTVERA